MRKIEAHGSCIGRLLLAKTENRVHIYSSIVAPKTMDKIHTIMVFKTLDVRNKKTVISER